ncbi:MAG: hypothetical protein AAB874_02525 [Patescibacteria group bacterium]
MPTEKEEFYSPNLIYRLFQNSALIVVSLGLLFGGVAILQTRIPFWSLVYGIPAIFLGIVMSVISFNEVSKSRIARSTEYHEISCRVCGKQTLMPMLTESTVCSDCQYKMALRLQITALAFFVMLAIPVTLHLTQTAQEIRQNAQEPEPSQLCESGRWSPEKCRCGSWDEAVKCDMPQRGRICQSSSYCCSLEQGFVTCSPYKEQP